MELYDVVMKLTGPVMPIGDCGEDERRLSNLVALCTLVDRLHTEIDDVASASGDYQASVKKAKNYASDFLTRLGISED
jgi:hypothetical protein